MVFEHGLSKFAADTLVEGSISTSDLSSYVLIDLFDSFGKETIIWFLCQNYADMLYRMTMTLETAMKLANLAMKLIVRAGIFLIDTRMPEMIKATV